MKIAIVGSCQVAGLAEAARAMVPGAEIEARHLGILPDDAEYRAEMLKADLIITNTPSWGRFPAFAFDALKPDARKVVSLPNFVFPGLHPDIIYIRRNGLNKKGPYNDYHCLIVAASYCLGLPVERALFLYNAYVYGLLGYFDLFAISCNACQKLLVDLGYDGEALFSNKALMASQFMYTVNHPAIDVLKVLAGFALHAAEVPIKPLDDTVTVHDHLADSFICPVFPEVARRIGVPASQTFTRDIYSAPDPNQRTITLRDYAEASYRCYEELDKQVILTPAVIEACRRLQAHVS